MYNFMFITLPACLKNFTIHTGKSKIHSPKLKKGYSLIISAWVVLVEDAYFFVQVFQQSVDPPIFQH